VGIGITGPDISFLLAARELGASYERTLTIGRQYLFADASEIVKAHAACGLAIGISDAAALVHAGNGYSEPLLRCIGARNVDSLDASAYEGATLVHDLNEPLPDELRGKYSLVFDGGSLEHVFNFPQALKNCMEAVTLGGHLITITPANNYFGHGFYQFSPELFYRALAPVNGFSVVTILVRSGAPLVVRAGASWARSRWYTVSDPEAVGARVTLTGPWRSLLFVLAERTALVEPFANAPQQSCYATAWSGKSAAASGRQRLPAPVRRAARLARALTGVTLIGATDDRGHFKRVDVADLTRSRST
jgi:hypothetical protein